tara:strand:+ start:780 stop:2297 length:1518 start_codon:yes stop_codon:yes gene_type:complete
MDTSFANAAANPTEQEFTTYMQRVVTWGPGIPSYGNMNPPPVRTISYIPVNVAKPYDNVNVEVDNVFIVPSANVANLSVTVESGNTALQPFNPTIYSSAVTTTSSTISDISYSTFIAEKNAFEQNPLVRLYTVYYPGEWHPANEKGNPTGGGAGHSWPVGFPYRFAEVRGDFISDIQYRVTYDGLEYTPYPIDSGSIQMDSSGKIGDVSLSISNFDNLITQLVENPFLVGNNTANAQSAIVNGELVSNIDPRTIPGNALFDQDVVDARGGNNVAFDYDSTLVVNGTWAAGKIDTRDLLGGVVEIKSTFANFLDYWPEHSSVKTTLGNSIQVVSSLPYRIGDNIKGASQTTEATIGNIWGDLLLVEQGSYSVSPGEKLYVVNPEADIDNFYEEIFKINELTTLDDKVATFSLTNWLQYFKLQIPKRKYFKNVCAWTYKGEECQYPDSGSGSIPGSHKTANGFFDITNATTGDSELDICAHNNEGCALRNNEIHFGGFSGTGRTIPR